MALTYLQPTTKKEGKSGRSLEGSEGASLKKLEKLVDETISALNAIQEELNKKKN